MGLTKQLTKTRLFTSITDLEDGLVARPHGIHPTPESPIRFDIIRGRLKAEGGGPPVRLLPIMLACLKGIKESLQSVDENPVPPNTTASPELTAELEVLAFNLGASSIGYTKLPRRWVFQDKAVMYDNAIVLAMEMDAEGINSAPSQACMKTVMETYRDLGRINNQLANFLRAHGYGAHAGHPLNGLALYPPLAQLAGLGWMGLNGLIITPEHGPRVRLGAVFTSIQNLPEPEPNPHSWIAEFCQSCRICIQKCPPGALFGEPVNHQDGRVTYVDNSLCFPYFNEYHGCSVCVKVCPFNKQPYQKIQSGFNRG
jgi:ferredoxin